MDKNGFSLVEVVIALAIFSILLTSLFSLTMGSLSFFSYARARQTAGELAQEAITALRSISDGNWNALAYERSAISSLSGQWTLLGEGTAEQIGGFVRTIDFSEIYRDANGNMVASTTPGSQADGLSKQATIVVSWQSEQGALNSLMKTIYLVNYQ